MRRHERFASTSSSFLTSDKNQEADPFAARNEVMMIGKPHHRPFKYDQDDSENGYSTTSSTFTTSDLAAFPTPLTSALTQISPMLVTSRTSSDTSSSSMNRNRFSIVLVNRETCAGNLPSTPKIKSSTFDDWVYLQAQLCVSPSVLPGTANSQPPMLHDRSSDSGRLSRKTTASGRLAQHAAAKRAEDLSTLEQHLNSFESFIRSIRRSRHARMSSRRGQLTNVENGSMNDAPIEQKDDEWRASITRRPSNAGLTPDHLQLPPATPRFFPMSSDEPFPRETTSTRYFENDKDVVTMPLRRDRGRQISRRTKVIFLSLLLLVGVSGSIVMVVVGMKQFGS